MLKIKGYEIVKKSDGYYYIKKSDLNYYRLDAKTERQAKKEVVKYHQDSLKSQKELKESNGSIMGALLNNL